MCPPFRFFMSPRNARTKRNGPTRLVLIVSMKDSAVVSSTTATRNIPALFTRMSGAPFSSPAMRLVACSMLLGSLTSHVTGIDPLMRAARSLSFASFLATKATRTPWLPSASAIPAPIPLDAPVTTAVFPPSEGTL